MSACTPQSTSASHCLYALRPCVLFVGCWIVFVGGMSFCHVEESLHDVQPMEWWEGAPEGTTLPSEVTADSLLQAGWPDMYHRCPGSITIRSWMNSRSLCGSRQSETALTSWQAVQARGSPRRSTRHLGRRASKMARSLRAACCWRDKSSSIVDSLGKGPVTMTCL